jgi:hypothetical protein
MNRKYLAQTPGHQFDGGSVFEFIVVQLLHEPTRGGVGRMFRQA